MPAQRLGLEELEQLPSYASAWPGAGNQEATVARKCSSGPAVTRPMMP